MQRVTSPLTPESKQSQHEKTHVDEEEEIDEDEEIKSESLYQICTAAIRPCSPLFLQRLRLISLITALALSSVNASILLATFTSTDTGSASPFDSLHQSLQPPIEPAEGVTTEKLATLSCPFYNPFLFQQLLVMLAYLFACYIHVAYRWVKAGEQTRIRQQKMHGSVVVMRNDRGESINLVGTYSSSSDEEEEETDEMYEMEEVAAANSSAAAALQEKRTEAGHAEELERLTTPMPTTPSPLQFFDDDDKKGTTSNWPMRLLLFAVLIAYNYYSVRWIVHLIILNIKQKTLPCTPCLTRTLQNWSIGTAIFNAVILLFSVLLTLFLFGQKVKYECQLAKRRYEAEMKVYEADMAEYNATIERAKSDASVAPNQSTQLESKAFEPSVSVAAPSS